MTPRERILGTLLGEKVDRPPFGLMFGVWGQTIQRWERESGIKDLDWWAHFGYEPGFHPMCINQGAWPPFEPQVLAEDDRTITKRDPRGIVLKMLKDDVSMPDFIDYPVHNRKEWEQYKEERLQPDVFGRFLKPGCWYTPFGDTEPQGATAQEAATAAAKYAADSGRPLQVGGFPWGVFGTARDIMGVEELLVSFYTDPEMVHDIMDTLTDLWLCLFEQVAQYAQIDHIHIWEDMAGKQGSLISPAMIEEFMMPNYRKIRDFAKRHNVAIVSVDSDGLVDELIPVMMANGMNMMCPFEVQAGCDIEKYRRLYPTLAMAGGINKHALAKNRGAIDAELAKVQRMLKLGRYVPAPDHMVPPDVPWESFVYFNERLKEIIGLK